MGEVERGVTPGGEVCAELFVRCWKGERDCDYDVID
jgi:hypothetical protein